MIKRNVLKFIAVITLTPFFYSCSSGDAGDDTINPPQETFGSWSPDFTNQTSDFSQTRTGSLETQQTRIINVTSFSSTTTSTEESINQDINDDGDLFDEIEEVVTTYSASDGLGSFQQDSTEISEDNDMGITVGNNFFSIKNGSLVMSKEKHRDWSDNGSDENITCEIDGYTYTLHYGGLNLWAEEISYRPNTESYQWSGTGMMIHAELYSYIDNDIAQNNNESYIYKDAMGLSNDRFGTSFNSQNSYDNRDETDAGCPGYDIEAFNQYNNYANSCEVFNNYYSTNGAMWYDTTFDSNYAYTFGGADVDYCPGIMFDSQGKLVSISKNSDNIYTIKINGTDRYSLPVKIFYKGYLAIEILDY